LIKIEQIPDPFFTALQKVKSLENFDEYIGAFVFGSLARGEQTKDSDVDMKVLTSRDYACDKVNHPYVNNIKLDISFNSIEQLREDTVNEMNGNRIPFICESIIIFDKENLLRELQKEASVAKPSSLKKKNVAWTKFMFYHINDKAKRNLKNDPASSLLAMGINLNEVLKYHYKLNNKWWVSNKRLLGDLRAWDPELARLLEKYLLETDLLRKYGGWVEILDYVAAPLGEWRDLEETNCSCKHCKKDLERLLR